MKLNSKAVAPASLHSAQGTLCRRILPGQRRHARPATSGRHLSRILQLAVWVSVVGFGVHRVPAATHTRSAASKRARAQAAFIKATRLYQRLKATPPLRRTGEDYKRVVLDFEQVYRIDPAYVKAPTALAAAAHTYEEMGQTYADDQFYSRAISSYQFLIQQYPGGSAAREAQFAIGKIYLSDLENPEEARTAFAQYAKTYPKSPEAKLAKREIQKINARLASHQAAVKRANEKTDETPAPLPQPQASDVQTVSPAREVNSHGLVVLQAVRSWVGPNYTRIVISTGGPVTFSSSRLVNPDRLVFDLDHTALGSELGQKVFPVGTGYLQRVRVAQFQPTVTRVVLDVQKIVDYSVFSLPNPFRMIIDIHGNSPLVASKAQTGPTHRNIQPGAADLGNALSPRGALPSQAAGSSAWGDSQGNSPAGIPETDEENAPAQSARRATLNHPTPTAGDSSPPAQATQNDSEFPGERQRIRALESSNPNLVASAPPAASPAAAGSPTLTRALGLKIGKVVIDPGHGGHDTGTIGPTGLREKDVVLDVALRLRRIIERRLGSEVIMTRHDDTFIPLEERTAIANEKGADLFISIHANASRDSSARGIETYYLNFTSDPSALALAARENATSQESVHQLSKLIQKIALSEKIDESRQFAGIVDHSMVRQLSRQGVREPNRGVKKAPFVVLIGANMPSILAEISFLTNPTDERLLRKPAYRQKIAEALYAGVAQYVSQLGGVKVASRTGGPTHRRNPPGF
ncbi:MAG TPA: N-acetylmuramoyl-L-alanine amidase [Terriglobia bacterium]|nr:N-acetylmuramoyl-L-alanine amidase [Terriglobia bacterium]